MLVIERFRHKLSALVLWGVFLALYVAGALLLVIGVVIAARGWWELLLLQAGFWAMSAKTAELFILVAGSSLILIIPFLQRRSRDQTGAWRAERRSEMKCRVSVAE